MTPEQAQRCFRTSEDVYTSDGCVVTIAALYSEEDDPVELAMVEPGGQWLPLSDLMAGEDR